MNRRTFLRVLGFGAIAAPLTKPLAILALKPIAPVYGTIGAIDRATYPFWRNLRFEGAPLTFDPLAMNERIYFITTQRISAGYFPNRATFSQERRSAVLRPPLDHPIDR